LGEPPAGDASTTSVGRGLRITLLTDRPQAVRRLLQILRDEPYEVWMVTDRRRGLGRRATPEDLVLLDVSDMDAGGFAALRRSVGAQPVPVLVFTTSPDGDAGIAALDAGADDLLTATMSAKEVAARIRSVMRRRGPRPADAPVLRGGPVTIDVVRRRVEVHGRVTVLTALELKLLAFLVVHPDEPMTRARLLDAVWGYSVGGQATVTVHIRRLREKIEEDPSDPTLIRTVWGIGYRFTPGGETPTQGG